MVQHFLLQWEMAVAVVLLTQDPMVLQALVVMVVTALKHQLMLQQLITLVAAVVATMEVQKVLVAKVVEETVPTVLIQGVR
jgi:hypothetical protein